MDTVQLYLSKLQLEKNKLSINTNRPDISVQIASLKAQISKQKYEKQRVENYPKAEAATSKQLDDINSTIDVLDVQLRALHSTLNNSESSVNVQSSATDIQVVQINDKLQKCHIVPSFAGTLLTKYIE